MNYLPTSRLTGYKNEARDAGKTVRR